MIYRPDFVYNFLLFHGKERAEKILGGRAGIERFLSRNGSRDPSGFTARLYAGNWEKVLNDFFSKVKKKNTEKLDFSVRV
jgi:hypothetical protein